MNVPRLKGAPKVFTKNNSNLPQRETTALRYALDDRVEALDDRVGDYTSSRF